MNTILTDQTLWMLLLLFLFLLALVHLIGKHAPTILDALASYRQQQHPPSPPPSSSPASQTPLPTFRLTITTPGEIMIAGQGVFEVVHPDVSEPPLPHSKAAPSSQEHQPQGTDKPASSTKKPATAGSGPSSSTSSPAVLSSRSSLLRSKATFEQAAA